MPRIISLFKLRFEPYFSSILKHIVPIHLPFSLGSEYRDKVEDMTLFCESSLVCARYRGNARQEAILPKRICFLTTLLLSTARLWIMRLNSIRCPLHRVVPIHLVGIEPVECGRVDGALEEEWHQQLPEPHLDRIGHDSPRTKATRILDDTLDPFSTQAFIRRQRLLYLRDVTQAMCQGDSILHRQRGALSSGGRDCMDRIPDEDHRTLVPEWLGLNIVDGIASNGLRCPNDLPEEGLLLTEYVEHALVPLVAPDLVRVQPPWCLRLRKRDKPGDLACRADMVADEGPLAKDEMQRVRRWRKVQATCKPAGAHQASVLRGGSTGVDELAGA